MKNAWFLIGATLGMASPAVLGQMVSTSAHVHSGASSPDASGQQLAMEEIDSAESGKQLKLRAAIFNRVSKRASAGAHRARYSRQGSVRDEQTLRVADAGSGSARMDSEGSQILAETRDAGALQEVIVTAQKYRQRAFDVPISMAVLGGEELQKLGITALEDLQFSVPGMYMDNEGNAQFIVIRGMSNFFGQGALVGTYLDEADVTSEGSFGLDLDAFDLARIEVLKGPQGTLYGEGSLGGTIRYIANEAGLNEFQMVTNVTASFDQYGAPGHRIEVAVNTPVVENIFGLRIAAAFDHEGGWVDQPAAGQKNVNSKDLTDVRIKGRWKPRSDLMVDAMEVIHRGTSGPYTGESPVGVYTQVFNLTTTPRFADSYNVTNLSLRWDPGLVTVVNSTTYFVHHTHTSNWGISLPLNQPPSTPFDEYYSETTKDESLSDELRISGDGAGRWRWTLGGFYKKLDDEIPPFLVYFDVPGPPGSPLPDPINDFSDINSSATSIFGDANYQLFDRVVVGTGVRYFRDNENALLVGDVQREQATYTSLDPRFYARYGLSKEVNLYASAAKGFRSGGFNGLGYPEYQPEHVWTYEVGTKMRLLGGRMSVDSDVFLSNYGGYQIVGIAPPPNPQYDITRNAGDARIKGIESNVLWNLASRWRVGLSGDYTNARFAHIAVLSSSFDEGDPLNYVPRYQITASAEREFSWRGQAGFARVDYTQRSRAPFRNRSIGPWYYSESDYMYLLGVRAGINLANNVQLALFGENLVNDRGYTGADSAEAFAPRQQPRTFGVDFEIRVE